jgi:PAS domain S-box-containing protein
MKQVILAKFMATALMSTVKRFHFSAQKKELEISPLPFTDSGIRLGWVNSAWSDTEENAPQKTLMKPTTTKIISRTYTQSSREADARIMKNCPDILCTLDERGRFITINEASTRILGYTTGEVEGSYFTDFVIQEDIDKAIRAAMTARSKGNLSGYEIRCYHKDGTIVTILWSAGWSAEDKVLYCVGRDATDIKSSEAALQETTQRYSSLFDHNPDAVYSLDLHGNFISANEKVAEMIDCPLEDILKMSFLAFVAPEYVELAAENFEKAKNGEKISYDIVMVDIRGQRRYINISNMPIMVNGKFEGIYGIVKDITESEETKQELKRLNESLELKIKERTCELEQAIKEMEAFSYSVSHDLRAPLRIINGYSKLLSNEYTEQFDADGKEFIAAIIDNTKYMGRLIDDLLNLSRLGREAINTVPVDMTMLTNVVMHEMKMNDETISADITIHDLKPCVCDQMLIRQVWINLISNAIKYSKKKGQPKIEIGSYEKGNQTVYYVKDNGAGFDMKFAAKLFGVFIRLHDRSEFDGTGVGLALVHRIVTKHGGKVWANGKVDEGAVFYFSLPNS